MVDAQETDFLEDGSVFRPSVTIILTHQSQIQKRTLRSSFLMICFVLWTVVLLHYYATKNSFQRQWTEKHLPEAISYTCPVGQCSVSCRRRYEMKIRLLRIHNAKKEFLVSILSKSQKSRVYQRD